MGTVKYVIEFTGEIEQDGGYWRKTPMEEFVNKVDIRNFYFQYKEGQGTDNWKPLKGTIKLKKVIVEP